jgi:ribosome recycling factor
VKVVRNMAEEGRISLRNLRRAARHELDALEKDGDLSSDELARAEKQLDKIIHAQEAGIEEALGAKEQELLTDA